MPFNEGWGQYDAAGAVQSHPRAGRHPSCGRSQRLVRSGRRGRILPAQLLLPAAGAPADAAPWR
ncbi:MAG: hypothetical protein ACLVJH_06080 [Faecalibacterium prausnitzii]